MTQDKIETIDEPSQSSYTQTAARNKEFILKLVEEGWRPYMLKEICTPDYIMHYGGVEVDLNSVIDFMDSLHTALPDLKFIAEDIIAEGDKVVTRWTAYGTHKGKFQGIFPTNKQVVFTGITISRIENGKLTEDWEEVDQLNFTQQFGAFPES